MTLRVGPYLYQVRFVDGLIDHDGAPCVGLCDNDAKLIYVSATLCEAEQIQTVCHEYMEAWIYHFGDQWASQSSADAHAPTPTANGDLLADPQKEAWCDLFGMAMTQFVVDWMHQIRVFAQQPATHPKASAPQRAATAQRAARPGVTPRHAANHRPQPVRVRDSLQPGPDRTPVDHTSRLECDVRPNAVWRVRVFEPADNN